MTYFSWVMPIEFDHPWWLAGGAVIPLLILFSRRSLAGLDPARRWTSMVLRSIVWLVALLALAGSTFLRENEHLSVMFVLDRSRSVPATHQEQQEAYIRAACKSMPKDDRVGVVSFAGQAAIEQLPSRGGIHFDALPPIAQPERTNISQALKMALATFPTNTSKRIVLFSDGNENVGDSLREALAASAAGVQVQVLPMRYAHRNEVYFDRMVVPGQAYDEEEIPVRLLLRSRQEATGTIMLYHDGQPIDLDPQSAAVGQRVGVSPGTNALQLKLPLRGARAHRFEARFVPDDPAQDAIPQNNVATGLTVVTGGNQVLLISGNPADDRRLVDALEREKIDVVMRRVEDLALDLVELESYAAVILANVPANFFTDTQQEALAVYVRDLGGGLIMTGGDEAFGAGGWIDSPVEEVMPVSFDVKDKKVMPRGALVLIMHSCELPRGNFWAEQVALKTVDTISTRDFLGVVAYSWGKGVDWEVPLAPAVNKPAIKRRLMQMQIGDMPSFSPTMDMAVKALVSTDAAQKHMIIISDGDPQPPSPATIKLMRKHKITCSTVGIGFGVHVMEAPMRRIANQTGGRYYPCRNPQQLPQIFVKEAKVIRRSLIDEREFQPVVDFRWSEILQGMTTREIPTLRGLVVTTPKALAEIPLVRQTKERPDPVLAYWQSGLGRTVAFTSGWWPYWGGAWTSWEEFGKLWAQIIRWSMRVGEAANLEVNTWVEGNKGYVSVDATGQDASLMSFLDVRGQAIDPEMSRQPVALAQTAPGRYEGTFDITRNGQYLLNLSYGLPGEKPQALRAGLSVPYAMEYRELRTNDALLAQLAGEGGAVLAGDVEADQVFAHTLPPSISRQPVWMWIVSWLLLPLFLLDVAVRRLASTAAYSVCVELVVVVVLLFGLKIAYGPWWGWLGVILLGELIGWTIRFRSIAPTIDFLTYTVATLGQAGERSGRALARLRRRRDELREGLAADDERAPTQAAAPRSARQAADERRKARFDVGGDLSATPEPGDLQEALGGAQPDQAAADEKTSPEADKEGKADDVRSRLLKAKRRARRDMKDRE